MPPGAHVGVEPRHRAADRLLAPDTYESLPAPEFHKPRSRVSYSFRDVVFDRIRECRRARVHLELPCSGVGAGGWIMTAVADRPAPAVVEASEKDLRAAVSRALRRSGYSIDELAEQARTGRFSSVRVRMAWVAIGDLRGRL